MNLITINSSFLTASKDGIRSIVSDMITRVQDGEVAAIDALVYVKKAGELFSEAEKQLRPLAESNYHLTKGEKQVLHSVEITEAETGVKYDYSACEDVIWNQLTVKRNKIEVELKEREAFLKTVTRPTIAGDADTGEAWQVHPPIRSGKMGLKLSIK